MKHEYGYDIVLYARGGVKARNSDKALRKLHRRIGPKARIGGITLRDLTIVETPDADASTKLISIDGGPVPT